jgi:hypothetical protein
MNWKKITLFDKVFASCLIVALVFGAYLLFRKSTFVTVVVKVDADTLRYEPWQDSVGSKLWVSLLFHAGMKETGGLNKTMAEVTSVYSYDTSPNTRSVYLTLRLNSVYNRSSNQYTYKGTPLLIGSLLNLNLDKLKVQGLVTYIEGVPDSRKLVKLKITAEPYDETPTFPENSGIKPHVAAAIPVGGEVKDSQGSSMIKILDKHVTDATKLTTTNTGQLTIQSDPLRKDVVLTLEVNATEISGRYFLYDDLPIMVGTGIPINLPNLFLMPEVTSITVSE